MATRSISWPCYLHECISPLWKLDDICIEFWKDLSGRDENLTFAHFSRFSDELSIVLQTFIKNHYVGLARKWVVAIVWTPHLLTSVFVHGILKAGAIFYPVLPHSCRDTLKYFNNHLIAVICLNDMKTVIQELLNFELYSPDLISNSGGIFQRSDWSLFLNFSNTFSSSLTFPQNSLAPNTIPAYVITTSGSFSNEKKIICVAHSCITANIIDLANRFGSCDSKFKPPKSVLLASPLTFDPSIVQIYFSLISHRRLIIPSSTVFVGHINLASLCLNAQVDWLQCTPSQFAMVDLQSRLKLLSKSDIHIVLGGEPFPSTLFSHSQHIKACIHGIYGTTEVSSWATFYSFNSDTGFNNKPYHYCRCSPPTHGSTPIGYPMFATHINLLNTNSGTVSELCVSRELGGFSIIRLKSPPITDDEFCQSIQSLPFPQMWKTGDLVQLGACGKCLWFVGRKDRIVKRFGHQICLERLEHTIGSFKFAQLQIQQCRCQILGQNGKEQLVLFAKVKQLLNNKKRRLFSSSITWRRKFQRDVTKRLKKIFYTNPDPWLPSGFVISSRLLPVSAHGKLIYKPLKPRTRSSHTESEILRLCHDAIGITFNFEWASSVSFLELGGTSLSALAFVETLMHRFPKLCLLRSKCLTNILTKPFSQFMKLTLKYLNRNKNVRSPRPSIHIRSIEARSYDNNEFKDERFTDLEQVRHLSVSIRGQFAQLNDLSNRCLSINKEWQLDLGKCVDASPIIVSNTNSYHVFIGSHSGLFAGLELLSGRTIWSQSHFVNVSGRIEASACAAITNLYSHPLIAVGTLNGELHIIEIERGIILNCYNTMGAIKSAPLFVPDQDLIISGSHSRSVLAYDLRIPSLQSIWSHNLDDSAIVASVSGFQTSSKTSKSILVSTLGGSMGCLDLRNPTKPVWISHDNTPIFCKPVSFLSHCSDSLTFRVSVNGTVFGLSTLTGNVIWKTNPLSMIGNYCVFSDPVLKSDDEVLILSTNNGFIYALDIFTGQVQWILDCRSDLKPNSPSSLNTPYLINTGPNSNSSLLVVTRADGMIIVCHIPQNSPVPQLSNTMCTYNLPNQCFSSPVLCSIQESDNLRLVCGCRDNQVYCFSLTILV